MLDPAIHEFLNDRKTNWLKKKVNNTTTDEQQAEFEQQALEQFSLAVWLPDAAKRAKQLSMVSHPSKFSHPSAKTSGIIANAIPLPDGFLRTGNVDVRLDVIGNAATLDVEKFLSLQLSDGKTILNHLENQSPQIEQQFQISTLPYTEIAHGLLAIKQHSGDIKTSGSVKQVYFPVDEQNYHLLSILTPSGLVYKLKERINDMRFSDQAKLAREAKKKNLHHDNGLSDLSNLTVIGYGGTKPQNISVLNNQNGGAAFLLSSMPPTLQKRITNPPKTDFFIQKLSKNKFKPDFEKFHNLLADESNNIHIRKKRDWITKQIIFQIADQFWNVRYLKPNWSSTDYYQNLPKYQKIWLDQIYESERGQDDDWFDKVKERIAKWFINTYGDILGSKKLAIADEQFRYIKDMIEECENALR